MAIKTDLSTDSIDATIAELEAQFPKGSGDLPRVTSRAERLAKGVRRIERGAEVAEVAGTAARATTILGESGTLALGVSSFNGVKNFLDRGVYHVGRVRTAAGLIPSQALSASAPLEKVVGKAKELLDANKDGKIGVGEVVKGFTEIIDPSTPVGPNAKLYPGMPERVGHFDTARTMPKGLAHQDGKGYWQTYLTRRADAQKAQAAINGPEK